MISPCLMSHEVLDGKNEQSQLQAVHMRSSGKDYYAIRAEDGKFYDRNGSGLANGFLRFPTVSNSVSHLTLIRAV